VSARRPRPSALRRADVVALCALFVASAPAGAEFDPAKEYVEAAPVASRYPDPAVVIATPAFAPGKPDFTSQQELEAFVHALSQRTPALRVRLIGHSQEGRAIPLLVFARPAAGSGADTRNNGKPTVLIIGQQHGNEPAGGEAALALAAELAGSYATVLDRVNVLIVPRANPDGAAHFVRGLANGSDVNRDHLLESTPEGRALGRVFVEFQPDVVLDCHEFGVMTRWLQKFGGLQRHDALIQYATVSNLPAPITDAAERMFRQPLIAALAAAGYTQSWYYASSYDMNDKLVSMGGVVPDTGRNIAGLRNAVSFLIEVRGVGIGRAHFKRRVHTTLVAMKAMIDAAAASGPELLALLRAQRAAVAANAGKGELIVLGAATPERHVLELLDPQTGTDRDVEVDWRSSLALQVRTQRTRPFAYLLPASESEAAQRLARLGVTVLRVQEGGEIDAERYRITRLEAARKEDVRRDDEDATPSVVRLAVAVEPARVTVRAGDYYVPLDQPLANIAAAALEPDTQSSYAANRVLTLPAAASGNAALPLYRVAAPVKLPTVVLVPDARE
jgi:hypothetical protein